jgi:hypothetical protein
MNPPTEVHLDLVWMKLRKVCLDHLQKLIPHDLKRRDQS